MPISMGIVAGSQKKVTSVAGTITTFTWVDDGGLSPGVDVYTISATGGTGTGSSFRINHGISGSVVSVTLLNGGTGYTVGDILDASDPYAIITITVTAVV